MTQGKRFFFYLAFGLGSLLLSGLSFGLWMFNPLPFAFSAMATLLVQLLGRVPTLGANDLGVILWIGLLWPLTFAPLHSLTFCILQRHSWSYLALLGLTGVLIAFGLQLYHSHPPFPNLPSM